MPCRFEAPSARGSGFRTPDTERNYGFAPCAWKRRHGIKGRGTRGDGGNTNGGACGSGLLHRDAKPRSGVRTKGRNAPPFVLPPAPRGSRQKRAPVGRYRSPEAPQWGARRRRRSGARPWMPKRAADRLGTQGAREPGALRGSEVLPTPPAFRQD